MIADEADTTIDGTPSVCRRILGVRVDDVSRRQAIAAVERMIEARGSGMVVTPNPEIVMLARTDADLRDAIESADLAPADGVGLRWAGRLLGQRIREVVPGSDLVPLLAERSATKGHRWFLLGGSPGVARDAGEALVLRHPGLVIAGTHDGSPSPSDDAASRALIEEARPVDVLLVAYGAPGQERWMARNQAVLRVPVAIGVGGTFNFLAGRSPSPPYCVRRANLIWLYRLATEPWRWRRQLTLVRFVLAVIAEAARQRRA